MRSTLPTTQITTEVGEVEKVGSTGTLSNQLSKNVSLNSKQRFAYLNCINVLSKKLTFWRDELHFGNRGIDKIVIYSSLTHTYAHIRKEEVSLPRETHVECLRTNASLTYLQKYFDKSFSRKLSSFFKYIVINYQLSGSVALNCLQ